VQILEAVPGVAQVDAGQPSSNGRANPDAGFLLVFGAPSSGDPPPPGTDRGPATRSGPNDRPPGAETLAVSSVTPPAVSRAAAPIPAPFATERSTSALLSPNPVVTSTPTGAGRVVLPALGVRPATELAVRLPVSSELPPAEEEVEGARALAEVPAPDAPPMEAQPKDGRPDTPTLQGPALRAPEAVAGPLPEAGRPDLRPISAPVSASPMLLQDPTSTERWGGFVSPASSPQRQPASPRPNRRRCGRRSACHHASAWSGPTRRTRGGRVRPIPKGQMAAVLRQRLILLRAAPFPQVRPRPTHPGSPHRPIPRTPRTERRRSV
jgi:hypothetical protein